MQYRFLGRTGVQVSPICLGCWMFGGKASRGESAAIIDRAIDRGINFLDTANAYQKGLSEEYVGATLSKNGKRQQIVLATKVHFRVSEDDPNAFGNSRRHILEQCETSLRRLRTDYIDLYQIHRPQSEVPIDETLQALDDLVRAGKVRYVGTSNFAAWQLVESLWASRELRLNRFVSEQPAYNLLDRRAERELLRMARTYDVAILPWSPLAGGLLTGKYRRDTPPPSDSRFVNAANDPLLRPRLHAGVLEVCEALDPLAEEKGCTLSQLSLAWCACQPGVTSPIIGPRTVNQLEDNLGALEVKLSEDDLGRIDSIVPPGRMLSPFYEADFGPHRHRW